MKRFKAISSTFIIVIAVIFGCNVYYLISLYNSIKANVERDVMTAMADADIDDLMYRAGRAQGLASNVKIQEETEEYRAPRKAEASTYRDENGQLISVRTEADGTVVEERAMLSENSSYSNQMVDAMSRQFHAIMEKYIPYDMEIMDSVLRNQLSHRFIYPDFLCVKVVNSTDSVICDNPKLKSESGLDSFRFNINPDEGIYYKAYMTPLTHHILSQMMGVIITVFLLLLAFSLAFWYLFRTVSKMRTIEEMKDDFVSNMTHELKTPIAIAYSANDALLNYDTDNDPQKKVAYLNIANKQLKRLGELVENILAMSMERRKAMKLKPEVILLRPVMEEIAASHRMRSEKTITINVNVDEVSIEADKTHISQVSSTHSHSFTSAYLILFICSDPARLYNKTHRFIGSTGRQCYHIIILSKSQCLHIHLRLFCHLLHISLKLFIMCTEQCIYITAHLCILHGKNLIPVFSVRRTDPQVFAVFVFFTFVHLF